ncbi:MAG: Crp/Fnr family transcriptional regulator [Deltaproteobacteria bacterium]|nr:Crp/Fnr family transcriptional regulator [Deltaproteobacteria bacterium]
MTSFPSCKTCSARPVGVFCQLEDLALGELENYKISNTYKKGQVIFYEGNQSLGLYCIFSGRVKLYKSLANGAQQIVRIASPGDLLGYRSLFAGECYHASAEAMENAQICYIDSNAFFSVLSKNPDLALSLFKKISRELRVAENLAISITHKTARERMAELLLMLKEAYGTPVKKGVQIVLKLSRQEMAEMIGTTQETSIRLLSEFKKEGIIEVQERSITLCDMEALLDAASMDI